jgi:hypothetical protein
MDVIPITPTSSTFGWLKSRASRSAGGTWKPLYLINSLRRSTILTGKDGQTEEDGSAAKHLEDLQVIAMLINLGNISCPVPVSVEEALLRCLLIIPVSPKRRPDVSMTLDAGDVTYFMTVGPRTQISPGVPALTSFKSISTNRT